MNLRKTKTLLCPTGVQALDIKPFEIIPNQIGVMGRPRFFALMNALSQCMSTEEVYLEVGTWQGASLIGTLLNNQTRAIAVDDFSQFGGEANRDILHANLHAFNVADRVQFFEMPFDKYFASHIAKDVKVGMYYYDGNHGTKETVEGLSAGLPHVTKNGIIVVDDIGWDFVVEGINKFLGLFPNQIRPLFCVNTTEGTELLDSDWWNGVMVMQKMI